MKKSLMVLAIAALYGNVYATDLVDTASVIDSKPIYDRVNEPRRECSTETVQSAPKERSMGGAIVGGVAGGLLGSQVGAGNGRTAATAAGAIAGVLIGDRIANPDQPPGTQQVERCRDVDNYHEVIKGYNVTYRYNGQIVNTTLPYEPGRTVRVGVSVIQDQSSRQDRQDDRRYRPGERN